MKKVIIIVASLLFFIGSAPVLAECDYNGYTVPTGSKAGGRTCQADGQWK